MRIWWLVFAAALLYTQCQAYTTRVQKDDTFEGFIEDEYEGAGKSVLLKAVGDMLLREIDCSRVVHVDVTDITSKSLRFYFRDGRAMQFRKWDGSVYSPPLAAVHRLQWMMVRRCNAEDATPSPFCGFESQVYLPFEARRSDAAVVRRGDVRLHYAVVWEDFDGLFHIVSHTVEQIASCAGSGEDEAMRAIVDDVEDLHSRQEHSGVAGRSESQGVEIKVGCYNVWNHNRKWVQRFDKIASQLSELGPSIMAFQEVRYDIFQEIEWAREYTLYHAGKKVGLDLGEEEEKPFRPRLQITQLMSSIRAASVLQGSAWDTETEWQYVYAPVMTYLEFNQGKFHVDEGLAIVTSHRIVSAELLPLSRDFNDEGDAQHQRGVLRAEIAVPRSGREDVYVNVFTTHLTLSAEARMRAAVEVWRHVKEIGGPQILLGDLNATPDDAAIQFLTGNEQFEGETGDFRDAHLWPGAYKQADEGNTFFAWNRTKRIDFFLVRGDIKPLDLSLIGIDVQDTSAGSTTLHSDQAQENVEEDTEGDAEEEDEVEHAEENVALDEDAFASDHVGLVATFELAGE